MFRFYNPYKVGVDAGSDGLFLANLEKVAPHQPSLKSSFITLSSGKDSSHKCAEPCPDTTCYWYGCFKDPVLQSEYILSCVHQKSPPSYLFLTFLILGWSVAETIASTWFVHNGTMNKDLVIGSISLFLFVIAFILSFFLSSDYFCNSRNSLSSSVDEPEWTNRRQQLLFHSHLQVGFIVILNLLFFLKIAVRIQSDYSCIPDNLDLLPVLTERLLPFANNSSNFTEILQTTIHSMTCIFPKNYSGMSSIQTILLMSICPQLLIAILYEPRIYLVLFCHLTSTVLLVVATISSLYVTLALILSALVTSVLLYELHFQRIQSFLNHRRLQQILRNNEKNADAIHAVEMRHMIGNVAHDLKTPLASFTNGLDLINDILHAAHAKVEAHSKAGEVLTVDMFLQCFTSVHSCLTNIRNTNSFMLMTINRCIDYTKASKGVKLVPKYETVDLVEALQFPIECMSNIQERIGIKLEPLAEEVCTHIITDKQWLQENLLCLLSNAVKYSAEGDVTITTNLISPKSIEFPSSKTSEDERSVDRSVNRGGGEQLFLLFEIEDNGIGLSEDAMKNLFNPFKQAQRLAGGTGLGLYSLAKRMEALKGAYGVKKRKDGKQGSLFWFALPYKPDSMAVTIKEYCKGKDNMSTKICAIYNGSPIEEKLEILIVDDSPSILKMSSMMLKRQGHEIWTAENGEIALKRIEEKWKVTGQGFDIVLMDLQMPVMDGLEATKRLRNIEIEGREWMINSTNNLKKQLIFGVSANSDYETTQEALEAGFDDFIGKPFSIEMFNSTVQKHLLFRV